MQSRLHSFIESLVNIFIGYSVAVLSQLLIFPLFDIHVEIQDNLAIGGFFTLVSLIRSYTIRRVFNKRTWRSNREYEEYLEREFLNG